MIAGRKSCCRVSSILGLLVVPYLLSAFAGCRSNPDGDGEEPVAPLPIEVAGLVALAGERTAVDLGAHGRLGTDRVIANGHVVLQTHGRLAGDVVAGGDLRMESFSRIDGDALIAGEAHRAPGADVTGELREDETIARVGLPSAAGLLRRLQADFGELRPSISLEAGEEATLESGDGTIASVVLGPRAVLRVTEASRVKVTDRLALGPGAKVVVEDGAGALIAIGGVLRLEPRAGIVQEGRSAGRALTVVVLPETRIEWFPRVEFGPGLLYAPEETLSLFAPDDGLGGIGRFEGSLVARSVATRAQARLDLSPRYLGCALLADVARLILETPSPGEGRMAPSDAEQVEIAGRMVPGYFMESLHVLDAEGVREVIFDDTGGFTSIASLRGDDEPTRVCALAVDCAGRMHEECVLVHRREPLRFGFTVASSGDVVRNQRVMLTGRILEGEAAAVSVNGLAGVVVDQAFAVRDIPLEVGANVLDVRITSGCGHEVSRRLVVGRQHLPMRSVRLHVGEERRVTVGDDIDRWDAHRPVSRSGHMRYRLVDADGRQIHHAGIPGTAPTISHGHAEPGTLFHDPGILTGEDVPGADLLVDDVVTQLPFTTRLSFPDLPEVARIELFDHGGRFLGAKDLASVQESE